MKLGPLLRSLRLTSGAKVYLWDESDNPAGSHKRRAAETVCDAAVQEGEARIVVGSCGHYGVAVALAAAQRSLDATVVLPRSARGLSERLEAAGARAVVVPGGYEDAVAKSRSLAHVLDAVDGNVDGPYAPLVRQALGRSALELLGALDGSQLGSVWVPVGNGTTLTAFAEALRDVGMAVPLVGVTSLGQNSVLASWPARSHSTLPPRSVHMTAARSPLVNWDALDGQALLDVLHETAGSAAVGVDDAALIGAANRLSREGVVVSPSGAAAVAGMMAYSERLCAGANVAVLTGR